MDRSDAVSSDGGTVEPTAVQGAVAGASTPPSCSAELGQATAWHPAHLLRWKHFRLVCQSRDSHAEHGLKICELATSPVHCAFVPQWCRCHLRPRLSFHNLPHRHSQSSASSCWSSPDTSKLHRSGQHNQGIRHAPARHPSPGPPNRPNNNSHCREAPLGNRRSAGLFPRVWGRRARGCPRPGVLLRGL